MIENYKALCSAVIIQAVKDYNSSDKRLKADVVKWVKEGNIFIDTMLPKMSANDILEGMKQYGSTKAKAEKTKA